MPGAKRRAKGPTEPLARSMHATLSKLFGWLVERKRIKANPAADVHAPEAPKSRDRVLSDAEIVKLWTAVGTVGKRHEAIIKLLLLTGCRRDEVVAMRRSELSDGGKTWTIPGHRTKNHLTHIVPLPPLARDILAGVEPVGDLMFSTTGRTPVAGFSKLKHRLDDKMQVAAVAAPRPPQNLRHRHGRDRHRATRRRGLPEPRQRGQGWRRRNLQSRGLRAGEEGGAGAVGGSCQWPRDQSQGEGRAASRERVVSKLPPWTGNDAAMQRWLDDKLDELLKEDGAKARSRRRLPLSREEKQALFPEDSDEGVIAAASAATSGRCGGDFRSSRDFFICLREAGANATWRIGPRNGTRSLTTRAIQGWRSQLST